jgi:hypothetical protein
VGERAMRLKGPCHPERGGVDAAGEDAMIVGHLPFLGRLASALLAGAANDLLHVQRHGDVAERAAILENAVEVCVGNVAGGRLGCFPSPLTGEGQGEGERMDCLRGLPLSPPS